ncbi:AI-2E family transporter [Chitinilyticum piscinae]|uniref:AI-2E family transporter n=1 Tax=Chitinilyticum piscinae TaxID=2866724 RepID=A0A8J7KBR5_9NEIS|nr:AI-2E family transporter [Chitinilyticum piscinae]MBE9610504.1 AI-2E family transporter [Chitinilyticum piscinae]
MRIRTSDLITPALGLCAILAIFMMAWQVMRPFIGAIIWAAILVLVTWRPFVLLRGYCRGNGLIAGLLMLLALSCLLLMPLVIGGSQFVEQAGALVVRLRDAFSHGWPELPNWLANLPWVGQPIQRHWQLLGQGDPELMAKVKEYASPVASFLLSLLAALGRGVLELTLSLLIALVFYLEGEHVLRWLRALMVKIAGTRGDELLGIAGSSIRGVVNGFVGTALVQGALAYVGYLIAGVPNAATFGFASCFLSVLPGGPSLLGLPVAAWMYHNGSSGWAIFIAVWMVGLVGSADNVVKPLLIGKNSDLPFVLIMFGVLGGAASMGVLGVFLGPTMLAVFYALTKGWLFDGITDPIPAGATMLKVPEAGDEAEK